ncbi:hypothetical protein FIBSPDRAFT_1038638 [Athelia psychrophila]|uniref:DUF6533 domain-containing protein n=1 Tax=Athelia psychrophila TaxID=1759441 RepID=A0A166SXB7_9AGAM|nr:hypothetical protein FIBSPDRAFT_1038638 [Fibularhizoctonia sp. CBS 109695]
MPHDPAAGEYTPLDSGAPANFAGLFRKNYLDLAFIAIIFYDHFLTLDVEIQQIWTLQWKIPKYIFVLNRYFLPAAICLLDIPECIYPVLDSYCNFADRWQPWLDTLALVISQGILVLRASAIYDNSKRMLRFLCTLFACSFGAVTGFSIWVSINTFQVDWYIGEAGCWGYSSAPGVPYYIILMPWIAFDGFLLILTLARYYQQRNELNTTIRLLARDSLSYFAVMFACMLFNVLLSSSVITVPNLIKVSVNTPPHLAAPKLTPNYYPTIRPLDYSPVHSLVCIAVSRMSLNIRGLAFKDVDVDDLTTMSALEMTSRTLEFKNTDRALLVQP